MQKKSNIVSKLVLSTAAALMGVGVAGATEQPEVETAQLANFLADINTEVEGKGENAAKETIADIGVTYKVTANGDTEKTAEVIDCDNSKVSKNVQIANKIDTDKNVTAIAAEAFKDCTKIETVEIPASVTDIGKNAFDGCSNLKILVFNGHTDEQLKDMTLDKNFLGSAPVESVYVSAIELNAAKSNLEKAGLSNKLEYNYSVANVNDLTGKIVFSNENEGLKVDWNGLSQNGNDENAYVFLLLREDKEDGKNKVALDLQKNNFYIDKTYVDTTAEFGKKYTYSVIPYICGEKFMELAPEDFYATSQYDKYGIVKGQGVTGEGALSKKLVDSVLLNYDESKGEVYTELQTKVLTRVMGADSDTWYVLDNQKSAYTDGAALRVKEWDINSDDKDTFENLNLDAISAEELENKEYRVFNLRVTKTGGADAEVALAESDDDKKPSEYAVYFELSKNMDKNSVNVVLPLTGAGDLVYSAAKGNLEIVDSISGDNAPKSEYGFAKIMLNSALPKSEQPFVMYADKLENSSSSSDSTDKKEENNSEDKKEENKNNSSNGSTSGSKGYATGDVAGFGMLHAAYSMLAAAGSTLLGLFRKKK